MPRHARSARPATPARSGSLFLSVTLVRTLPRVAFTAPPAPPVPAAAPFTGLPPLPLDWPFSLFLFSLPVLPVLLVLPVPLPADESSLLLFGLTASALQAMSSVAKTASSKPGFAITWLYRNSHDAASCFATTLIDPATGKQTSLSPGIASSSLSRPDSAPAYVSHFDGLRRPPAVSFRHYSPPPPRYSSGYSSSRAAPSDYSSSRSSSGYSSSRASSYYGSHRGDSSHHHRGDRTNHRGDSYHQRSRY